MSRAVQNPWRVTRILVAVCIVGFVAVTLIAFDMAYRTEQAIQRIEFTGGDRHVFKKDFWGRNLPQGWIERIPRAFRQTETVGLQDVIMTRAWAKDLEHFRNARIIGFHGCQTGDMDLSACEFPLLDAIVCTNSQITIAKLPRANSLRLWICREGDLSAHDIGALVKYPSLENMALQHSNLDDACLLELPQLPIKKLNLTETRITDLSLERVSQLKSLQTLRLSGNTIHDRGIWLIRECQELKSLDINGTQVTNVSVPVLRQLQKLKELNVSESGITAAGVVNLLNHPSLEWITISSVQWSESVKIAVENSRSLRDIRIVIANTDADMSPKIVKMYNELRPLVPAAIGFSVDLSHLRKSPFQVRQHPAEN